MPEVLLRTREPDFDERVCRRQGARLPQHRNRLVELAQLLVSHREVEIHAAERVAREIGRVSCAEAGGHDRLEQRHDLLILILIEENLRELARSAERAGIERNQAARRHFRGREIARAALRFRQQIQGALVARVPRRAFFEHVARALRVADIQQRRRPLRAQRQALRPLANGAGECAGGIAPASRVLIHLAKRAEQLGRVLNGFLEQRDGLGIAVGGLVRLREHRDRLDLVWLIGDDRHEHRDRFIELAIQDVETPEHRRHAGVRVAIGLLEIHNRALRVGAPICRPRVRHLRHPRVQASEYPVCLGVGRIRLHRSLAGGDGVGRAVEPRI